MRRFRFTLAVTIATPLLALLFFASGIFKLARLDFEVAAFERYGIPGWLMIEVGVTEVAAALLLLRPRTATLGAITGSALMLVAIPTHVAAGEPHLAPLPLAVLAALIAVGWGRRAELAALIAPRRAA
ncbi:MAG: DoxX family protein [Planctomycetota bacterium]